MSSGGGGSSNSMGRGNAGVRIGILSVQGDVAENAAAISSALKDPRGFDDDSVTLVKTPQQVEELDGLVIPGGESTTIINLLHTFDLARPLCDRLTGGQYEPVAIDALPDGRLRGYIQVLNLIIEWNNGQLEWIDPATDAPILTYADQRDRADREHLARMQERQAGLQEREARLLAEERAEEERRARMQAEARARQLEEELQRLRGE